MNNAGPRPGHRRTRHLAQYRPHRRLLPVQGGIVAAASALAEATITCQACDGTFSAKVA
jgi:hypothetical protein